MNDGFRYINSAVEGWPKRTTLRVIDPLNKAALAEIKVGDYDTLWIDAESLSGIEQVPGLRPDLERLRIQSPDRIDASWISELDSLRLLQLHGKIRGAINFDRLTKLKAVDFYFCPTTEAILESDIRPTKVSFHKLDKSLAEFPPDFCRSISVLGLYRGPLTTLDGLEHFGSLVSLGLMDMGSLENIDAIASCQSLEMLDVTACNKIVDCRGAGSLQRLEWLVWENRELDSLKCFLPGLNLEVLRLGERTEIRDGDTSVVLKFPNLKHVSFRNKRRYNRRVQDLNASLAERNPGPFRTLAQRQLERLV